MKITEELPSDELYLEGVFELRIHRGNHLRTQRVVTPLLNNSKPIVIWEYYTQRVTQKVHYRFTNDGIVVLAMVEFPNASPKSAVPELRRLTEPRVLYDDPTLVGYFMMRPDRREFVRRLYHNGVADAAFREGVLMVLDDIQLRNVRGRCYGN